MRSDRPRADPAFFVLTAPRAWRYESDHSERYITAPGYFDEMVKNLRCEDEVAVIAFGDDPPRHFVAVVDAVVSTDADAKVRISVLHRFQRSAPDKGVLTN